MCFSKISKYLFKTNTQMSKREYEALIKIYTLYLKENGCTYFTPFFDGMSAADAQVISATTTATGIKKKNVLIEFKEKNSLFEYKGEDETYLLIDSEKIKKLQTVGDFLKSPVFIIADYHEAILIWQLKSEIYPSKKRWCNKTTTFGSNEKVLKDVAYLEYMDADYIINKRNYKQKSKEQLYEFIQQKTQNEYQ